MTRTSIALTLVSVLLVMAGCASSEDGKGPIFNFSSLPPQSEPPIRETKDVESAKPGFESDELSIPDQGEPKPAAGGDQPDS